MSEDKRKRSPNWMPSEKTMLVDLVERHIQAIENKKTDGASINKKLSTWKDLSTLYNSQQKTYCSRTAENLKAQWDNMKKLAKKEQSSVRLQKTPTGGGPANPKQVNPLFTRVLSLLKSNLTREETKRKEETVVLKNENLDWSKSVTCKIQDWKEYESRILQSPISAALRIENINDPKHSERYSGAFWASRRRPTLKTASSTLEEPIKKNTISEQPNKNNVESIDLEKQLARKKMENADAIKDLDVEIKKEILKQEKIKTRILLLEMRLKNKQLQSEQLKIL